MSRDVQLSPALERLYRFYNPDDDGGNGQIAIERSGDADAPAPLLRSLAQLLEDPDALKPPVAVVPRLAYCGRVTLLAAREKTGGKSTLLTAGAAAVTRGADFLGERCLSGPVLWVSADQEHVGDLAARAVRFGADPQRFHVLWPRGGLAELTAVIARVAPVLVVIDTLANFARVEDPHSSAEWPNILLPLITLARERGLAVVIAHHANKGEAGGYRDSTAIGASVDLILELEPDGASPGRRNVTKALGRWAVQTFALELVGDTYQLIAGGALSLEARALAFVGQHPGCSKRVLRDGVGGKHDELDAAIGRLVASGAVRNGGGRTHAYTTAPVEQIDLAPAGQTSDDDTPF